MTDLAELVAIESRGMLPLEFYISRGLKNYCIQEESTELLCTTVVKSSLEAAGTGADEIAAVVLGIVTNGPALAEQQAMTAGLSAAGIGSVPLLMISPSEECSGFVAALEAARRTLCATGFAGKVLIIVSGRVMPGSSRIDPSTATILSDGIAACILSLEPGPFKLLAAFSHTSPELVPAAGPDATPGPDILRGYKNLKIVANRLYEYCQLEAECIEALFCTNGSLVYSAYSAAAAALSPDRAFQDTIPRFGHVHACDHVIGLAEYGRARGHKDGAVYMLLSWSPHVYGGVLVRSNMSGSLV
nr:hypothetical protein [uncultured Rhodopila sp.]